MFVLEQRSFFRDLDGRDADARHLRALEGGALAGALRLLPAGPGAARVGRVVVAERFRGRGLGRVLMAEALAEHRRLSGGAPVDVSAQVQLRAFYETLGFRAVSEPYDDDGILHLDMRREGEPATTRVGGAFTAHRNGS